MLYIGRTKTENEVLGDDIHEFQKLIKSRKILNIINDQLWFLHCVLWVYG